MTNPVPPLGPSQQPSIPLGKNETSAQEIFKKILSSPAPERAAKELGEEQVQILIEASPREAEIFLTALRPLDASTRKQVVEGAARGLRHLYIEEKKGAEMATLLENNLRAGKYDACISPLALKRELMQDLRTICSDPHLDIVYDYPSHPKDSVWALLDTPSEEENRKLEETGKEYDRARNFGIAQVDMIGTVGYFKIDHFCSANFKETAELIDVSMQKIANASALIIDLRDNDGGMPDTVALLASYFFDGEPFVINQTYERSTHNIKSYIAHPELHPIRFGGTKPIYILTSDQTFSAAEELVYDLKAFGRSTLIIGQTTKGGARPTRPYIVNEHFHVSIPKEEARNPRTGTNWDGVGITPDQVLSKEEDAKKVALAHISAT